MAPVVRADLADAHRRSLAHVAAPGAAFTAAERLAIATAARDAYLDPSPPPPWARPYGRPALDVAHRLARHAGTLTLDWYEQVITEGMHPLEWVEVVGIVCAVVPPVAFARAAGLRCRRCPTRCRVNRTATSSTNWHRQG